MPQGTIKQINYCFNLRYFSDLTQLPRDSELGSVMKFLPFKLVLSSDSLFSNLFEA